MKRTILIPLLLSTFLLVGCESELDRCIEGNFSVDIREVREKYSLWIQEEIENPNKYEGFEAGSFTSDEKAIARCVIWSREDFSSSYLPFDNEMKVFDENVKDCIQENKEEAKKICHRQGIY